MTVPSAALTPRRAGVRRSYVDVAGAQVHVRESGAPGAGPTLVCLHMSPASGVVFEAFAAAMGARRHVVAPDTPGFGASDPPAAQPDLVDYAAWVVELIENLDTGGPVDLLGYHTGSFIAVEVAARRPDLVRGIVAVSLPVFDEAELARLRPLYDATPIFEPSGQALLEKWRWFVDFYGATDPESDMTVTEAARLFVARLAAVPDQWWGHDAVFRYDVRPRLAELQVPLSVINLDDDVTEPTRRVEAHLRDGRLVDATHWRAGFLDHRTDDAVALVDELLT